MKLLIAGGGTGGHLFPGIAIAEELLSRDSSHQVLFAGTQKGLEALIVPKRGYPVQFISISGFSGKRFYEKLKMFFLIPISFVQSFFILKKFKPDVVLGVGGYASFPILFVAFFLRIKKKAIQEQNFKPGLANSILSYLVDTIFVSFEATQAFFPPEKVLVTGNPVRKFKMKEIPSNKKFTIFILGGSQGSHSLNRALLEALPYLEPIKNEIHLIHQTGKKDHLWVTTTYFDHHWEVGEAEIYDFIEDMDEMYSRADFIVCRAGASTVSEVALLGKAVLFVPFLFAAHNHQEENAKLLEKEGAARLLLDWQLNGSIVAKEIQYAFEHPRELEEMRKKILPFSRPYATQTIVDELLR
ncbi:MAG: undecaprenyldiphospho-muramoylpentapeptide beta-N-acetylglucosaminyltransferase [Deltaproteobacteria bacterium]